MTDLPSFDDIFSVMAAASVGDLNARVVIPDNPPLERNETRFAIALNILLEDLALRAGELRSLGDDVERRRADEKFRGLMESAPTHS